MAFFDLFAKFAKKVPKDQTYLALTVIPDKVLACVFTLKEDQVLILGVDARPFKSLDYLTHQAALAIDNAAQAAQSDVVKVVYGLSYRYLEAGQFTNEIAGLLKNLSEDLELSAQAFIPIPASINHLLKIEEGVTPQAIVIGAYDDFAEVHLIENNNITASYMKDERADADQILPLIKKLKGDDRDLPSRIIVWGSYGAKLAASLEKHQWDNFFLHAPKIETFSDEKIAKAVAFAQAADLLGYEPQAAVIKPHKQEPPHAKDQFGFIEGEDILLGKEEYAVKIEKQQPVLPPAVSIKEETAVSEKSEKKEGFLGKIFNLAQNRQKLKKAAIGAFVLIFLLFLAAGLFGQFLTQAKITVQVNAKIIEKDFKAEVGGTEVSAKVAGSQKAVATGSKKIGQNAKGEATLLNWTTAPISLSSGTVLITKNGLKFTLDSEATVASRSASTPGQANAGLTALEFGASGNVSSGTDLTFQKYDELLYSARAASDFTGGDEKQVTVVSKDDLLRLEKSQTENLVEKAKNELLQKVTGQKIHEEAIVIEITRKNFDKKEDEEASLVTLDMEVEAKTLSYEQNALKDILAGSLAEEVPQGFQARGEDIEILEAKAESDSAKAKTQEGQLTVSGKLRADLVPKLDEVQLASEVAGKSLKNARAIIKKMPEVSDVTFDFRPNLPTFQSLPRDKAKIQFKIEAI